MAIAQCASLAMHEVLYHKTVVASTRVPSMVRRVLYAWDTSEFYVHSNFPLQGTLGNMSQKFDHVAVPAGDSADGAREVAVQVLSRTHAPRIQAERYGFLVLNIKGTRYDSWPRIAVVSNADAWSRSALRLVESLSAKTVAVRTGDAADTLSALPSQIEQLAYG